MDLIESLKHPKKIFFGWWTVLATGIMTAWGYGIYLYSFGLYFEPLQKEFGWTRAQISGGAALRRLEGGLEGPFGGYFTDKYGPRAVNLVGFLIAGLGLCLMYYVNSLWSFFLVWGFIVCTGFNFGMWGPLGTAIANWFVKKRGLATGMARMFIGILGSVIPTLMLTLIMLFGWRMASLIAGFITWGVGIPLTWFFVRPRRPEYYGMLPDGAAVKMKTDTEALIKAGQMYTAKTMGETEFTVRQAMRTVAFWVSVSAGALRSWAGPLFTLHLIPYLSDMGIDPIAAAATLGFMILASTPGRLIGGIISDRVSIYRLKYIFIATSILEVTGLLALMFARSLWMVYAYSILRGMGLGIRTGADTQISGRYFGRKAYSTITGIRSMIGLPVGAFAPIYVGWLYDTTGSYTNAFEQGVVFLIISIILWYFFNPPKRVAAVSDIENLF